MSNPSYMLSVPAVGSVVTPGSQNSSSSGKINGRIISPGPIAELLLKCTLKVTNTTQITAQTNSMPAQNTKPLKKKVKTMHSSTSSTIPLTMKPVIDLNLEAPKESKTQSKKLTQNDQTINWTLPGKKRKRGRKPLEKTSFVCSQCKQVDTPQIRSGPLGPRMLCNACGLQYSNQRKAIEAEKNKKFLSISSLLNEEKKEDIVD